MAGYWCVHCYRFLKIIKKRGKNEWSIRCPFCQASWGDLFPVKKCGIKIPEGAKHGDYIGYPE
jgi:hypothetical protein